MTPPAQSPELFPAEDESFTFALLDPSHLSALLKLQAKVLAGLGELPWLRENTAEAFASCLEVTGPHSSLGAFAGDELIAAAILYDGGVGSESIKRYFTDDESVMRSTLNLKLVLTSPGYRRHRLGKRLISNLRQRALEGGSSEILCTIHEDNAPSQGLFTELGYKVCGKVQTKYGSRLVFSHRLEPACEPQSG